MVIDHIHYFLYNALIKKLFKCVYIVSQIISTI